MNVQYIVSIALLILSILVVIVGIVTFFYNIKLFFYLKKIQYDQWKHLTTIGHMGPGMSNPSVWFRYIYTDSTIDDFIIKRYKKILRTLLIFIVLFIVIIVSVAIGMGFYIRNGNG